MSFAREIRSFGVLLSRCAPYVLLELLLPGGTLCALLLFLYQRRRPFTPCARPQG